MNTEKIQIVETTYFVNNENDEARTHIVSANIRQTAIGERTYIENGAVYSLDKGEQLAFFTRPAGGNLNIVFMGEDGNQPEIYTVVNEFLAACE